MDRTLITRRRLMFASSLAWLGSGRHGAGAAQMTNEATWTDDAADLEVTWDSELWGLAYPDDVSTAPILYDTERIRVGGFQAEGYYFAVRLLDEAWRDVDDASTQALQDWFSQGMNESVVVEEFITGDAYGWLHYADFQSNPRTFSVLQYSVIDPGRQWLEITLSLDAPVFTEARMEDLLDGLELNGEPVLTMVDQADLIELIADTMPGEAMHHGPRG